MWLSHVAPLGLSIREVHRFLIRAIRVIRLIRDSDNHRSSGVMLVHSRSHEGFSSCGMGWETQPLRVLIVKYRRFLIRAIRVKDIFMST